MPLIPRVISLNRLSTKTKEGVFPPLFSWLLPAAAFLIPFFVYLLGLPGGFEFDDGVNIVKNEHLRIESFNLESLKNAALSSNSGPLRRPVAMLSFALNYYFFQDSIVGYKVVNIGIHAFNALLIYFLSLLIFRRLRGYSSRADWTAFAVAILWSVLPINLTSVLYIIQRMVSLGGAFALIALIAWFFARLRIERNDRFPWFLSSAFLLSMLLAILCKETYVLTALVVILLDWMLFTRQRPLEKAVMRAQVGGLLVIVVLMIMVLAITPHSLVGDYSQRPFDMSERLLTQGRVLWFYIGLIIFPSNLRLGLYHDHFALSHGLFEPITTAISILLIVGVVFIAFLYRSRNPLLFLGVAWFFCWHLMESTVVSLELVHEHRNYLASLGIVWLGVCCIAVLKNIFENKSALYVVVVLVITLNLGVTSLRAKEWSDLVDHALAEVSHHPESVRAKYQLGRIYFMLYHESRDENFLRLSHKAFFEAASISDYDLLPWFGMVRAGLILNEETAAEHVKSLASRMETGKIPASTIVALSDFQECIKAGQCEGLQLYYIGLIDSLMKNTSLDQKSLAQLYTLKASYYSEIENSYDKSYEVLKVGTQVLPLNYHLRKSLLYYYVITVKLDEAARELEFFWRDFSGNDEASRVTHEICNIFKEREYLSGCDFMVTKRELNNENNG